MREKKAAQAEFQRRLQEEEQRKQKGLAGPSNGLVMDDQMGITKLLPGQPHASARETDSSKTNEPQAKPHVTPLRMPSAQTKALSTNHATSSPGSRSMDSTVSAGSGGQNSMEVNDTSLGTKLERLAEKRKAEELSRQGRELVRTLRVREVKSFYGIGLRSF